MANQLSSGIKLFAFLSLFAVCIPLNYSYAACIPHALAGSWKAESYNKYSPKVIQIIHNCDKASRKVGGVYRSEWEIRVFHNCRPADCIWGRSGARRQISGVLDARFQTFSAKRSVTIVPSGYRIEVQYSIDYLSERRKDVSGKVYMTRY